MLLSLTIGMSFGIEKTKYPFLFGLQKSDSLTWYIVPLGKFYSILLLTRSYGVVLDYKECSWVWPWQRLARWLRRRRGWRLVVDDKWFFPNYHQLSRTIMRGQTGKTVIDYHGEFEQAQSERLLTIIPRARQCKTLELYYPIIQFLNNWW